MGISITKRCTRWVNLNMQDRRAGRVPPGLWREEKTELRPGFRFTPNGADENHLSPLMLISDLDLSPLMLISDLVSGAFQRT